MRSSTGPAIGSDTFRRVLGHFVTGVTVVTALDPPLVMVALDRRRFITPTVRASGRYAVNILSEDQAALSDCFAGAPVEPSREAFCGARWRPGETGLPLLDGAIAWLECTVVQTFGAGDHDLFIARVDAMSGSAPAPALPLVYYRRRYLHLDASDAHPVVGKPES